MAYMRLGDLLIASGVITQEQLDKALAVQKETHQRLGDVLMQNGFITERNLIDALQIQLGVEFVDLTAVSIPVELARYVPRNIARKFCVVPVKLVQDTLYLAMSDPLDFVAQEQVKAASRKKVIPMIATRQATEQAIARLYGNEGTARVIEEMKREAGTAAPDIVPAQMTGETADSAPTIRFVNSLIVQSNIVAKRLSLFIDTIDVVDEQVIADPMRLNQILLNILSNAVKFTPTDGMVSLRIVEKPTAPKGYADYEFHIRDNGIGISEEFRKHIFEQFSREETSTVSKTQGTGLGMSITKSLVDMMGGTITVESEPGKGSEFVVALRFPVSGEKREPKQIAQLEGLRALVADDDINACLNVSKMLRSIGMRPDWTISGKEAVIRAKDAMEQGDAFSVYIIDWLIPDMNGIEVVHQVRKIIGDATPIIILTAYDWTDIETEAKEAGVTAFCAKPLFMSELRSVLAKPFGAEDASAMTEKGPDFSGKKLLLVEDNELNLEIASTILQETGFEVDTAENGQIALEKVENAPADRYDLILMDIQMPVMDGYEATRRIRALSDKEKASVPIVAMTANAFEDDRKNALNAGMNGHIAKPLDLPKLFRVLSELMR